MLKKKQDAKVVGLIKAAPYPALPCRENFRDLKTAALPADEHLTQVHILRDTGAAQSVI